MEINKSGKAFISRQDFSGIKRNHTINRHFQAGLERIIFGAGPYVGSVFVDNPVCHIYKSDRREVLRRTIKMRGHFLETVT